MKVKVQHSTVFTISAQGSVEFMRPYLDKVASAIMDLKGSRHLSAGDLTVDTSPKSIIVTAHNMDPQEILSFKNDVLQKVVLLAEHGPDADLLEMVLSKHPQLRGHPRLADVVSSFENMTGVVKEVLGDARGIISSEVQRREQSKIELVPEDLMASGRSSKSLDARTRAELREKARLGQSDEQKARVHRSGKKLDAELPAVYRQVSAAQQDPEAVADAGNVFTRPSK